MPEEFDKEVLFLLIVFTAKEDILCLFVAMEQLKKVDLGVSLWTEPFTDLKNPLTFSSHISRILRLP